MFTRLILRSLAIAIVTGALIAIASHTVPILLSKQPMHAYDPGISEEEFHSFDQLTVAQMKEILEKRQVTIGRRQVVAYYFEDIHFWRGLASDAWVPVSVVFLACLTLGYWQSHDLHRSF